MVIDPAPTRRPVLKVVGAAGALGGIGSASARQPRQDADELRLFSEQAVDNAMEVVTQQNHAYVATGDGMAIVDWRNPNRPELVADIEASSPDEIGGDEGEIGGVLDVKVNGDVAAMAHNDGTGITTVDVSDPENPELVAQFGEAPMGDEEIRPFRPGDDGDDYFTEVFPLERYYAGEGNAHYVQPSPDGDYTYVGDEKFPNLLEEDPNTEQYGGIRIFDTSDWDAWTYSHRRRELVARVGCVHLEVERVLADGQGGSASTWETSPPDRPRNPQRA